ncbi:MAG TPA: glycosyltransferase [Thermoflexales bacterium]|nr:glycosyltransferase [Thermoflexales bacterium]
MKIVHIYKDYYPILGGIENHIRRLAEAQSAAGHTVTVLVTDPVVGNRSSISQMNGVRLVREARQVNVQSAPISMQFAGAVRRETNGADIAHLHAPYPIGEACNLFFGRAKKTVITWHSDIVRQKTLLRAYAPILRQVIARADCIVPTSMVYAQTSPWLKNNVGKCHVIPLGVDDVTFHPASADDAATRDLRASLLARVPSAKMLTISAGRLRYYKGFDDLIRAMPTLPAEVAAVIVGIGPMEAEWKALAQQMGVADRVIFAGEVSDAELPVYYRACDLFVLPANARAEAFGTVILEGMASGLPVVCTDVGSATSWVNQHEQTGYVIAPHDPAALAGRIGAFAQSPALRASMGAAARARVEAEFTEAKMIERVEALYRALIAGAAQPRL